MNPQVHDQLLHISQYYPRICTQQGEAKPRRRRKKNKEETSGLMMRRKRKLSEEQVNLLEQNFGNEQKLESERKEKLASEIGLDPRQVAVWFQNRRARWKTKKLEEEYSKLNTQHETNILNKCRLEDEILKLKKQLREAEKEIERLVLERAFGDRVSSNSPTTSSLSMEPPFLGEFGFHENTYEWVNLYMPYDML